MTEDSSARELPLLLGAIDDVEETLMLIGAPDKAGVVHVRSWSADAWSAPPTSRAERASALLEWLEQQGKRRRPMNQSLYALRLWLQGIGGGGSSPR